jgi:hypothetical protein
MGEKLRSSKKKDHKGQVLLPKLKSCIIDEVWSCGNPFILLENQTLIEEIIIILPDGEKASLTAEYIDGYMPYMNIKIIE